MVHKLVKKAINSLGYEITKSGRKSVRMPIELTPDECAIIEYVKSRKLSMVSYERLWATLMACKHVIESTSSVTLLNAAFDAAGTPSLPQRCST